MRFRVLRKAAMHVVGALALSLVLFFGLLEWPLPSAPVPQQHRHIVIDGARIVDVRDGRVTDPTRILVTRGTIAAIAPDVVIPKGARVIDGAGLWVMPGLHDMHSHSWQVSPQLHLPLQLAYGVTSVRDMMGCPQRDDPLIACHADKMEWNAQAQRGNMATPRFAADATFYYNDPELDPAGIQLRVRSDVAAGTTLFKVYNNLTLEAFDALVSAAHRENGKIAGHVPRAVPLDSAIAAGQASLDHGRIFVEGCFGDADAWRKGGLEALSRPQLLQRMLAQRDTTYCDRQMERMAETGIAFVPTLVTREEDARAADPTFLNDPRLELADPLSRWALRDDAKATSSVYATAVDRALLAKALLQAKADTLAAHKAGVRVLVGSDTIIAGPRLHDEMELMSDAGLSPADVLKAATFDAARFLGEEARYGTVEPGKKADLLLLRANPLDKISNTRAIAGVVTNSQHYDRQALDALVAYVRGQARHPANWVRMIWGFLTSPAGSSL